MTARAVDLLPIATVDRTAAKVVLASTTPYGSASGTGRETRIMVDITARAILDSAHPQGDACRLTTFLFRYPKFIHAEHCRHRTMSLCVSSSRAVPVAKNLEEVRSDELRAGPVWWGREQKGMISGEELSREDGLRTDYNFALMLWREAALRAADYAERMRDRGVHKSIVNRLLEPFLHVNVLCTVTTPGLMNFFGLRLDKAAQPEMRALAEAMLAAYGESKPTLLQPGEWHLPFINNDDHDLFERKVIAETEIEFDELCLQMARKVSTARCARLSYTSFETGRSSTIEEDLALYDRLIMSRPIHASPAEHQATPDIRRSFDNARPMTNPPPGPWTRPELHGNLSGWVQHRKLLPGEAVAGLPEGYAL